MKDEDFDELLKQLSSGQSTRGSWREVRAEFDALGQTLGRVLHKAWESQEADSALGRLRELVASATEELRVGVEGTPEAQQARERLQRLTDSVHAAAERAGDEVRPQLLHLLRGANAELRRRSGLQDTGA